MEGTGDAKTSLAGNDRRHELRSESESVQTNQIVVSSKLEYNVEPENQCQRCSVIVQQKGDNKLIVKLILCI